jgi:hypothetical protein
MATLKDVPAVGVGVEGSSVNEESWGARTVTGLLGALVAVHERNTAMTV